VNDCLSQCLTATAKHQAYSRLQANRRRQQQASFEL
jgi:hypothetical protein